MKKTTMELLELLHSSSTPSTFLDSVSDELIEKISLNEYLTKIISEKQISKSDIIRKSGLDRGYVYDIFSGSRVPSRDKVLAICFAASLSENEVQTLLKSTGYPPLYARIERDSIILFALIHQLSLTDVNELLYEMSYPYLS